MFRDDGLNEPALVARSFVRASSRGAHGDGFAGRLGL
jgi:hypothetical protein